MMGKAMIDLDILTDNGKVHNLSGHDRGLAARERFALDGFDHGVATVDIRVPDHIYAVSPSFVQGLLAASFAALGSSRDAFFARYNLVATDLIKRQFERGISAILTDRSLSLH
jgi:hypothetical protein